MEIRGSLALWEPRVKCLESVRYKMIIVARRRTNKLCRYFLPPVLDYPP